MVRRALWHRAIYDAARSMGRFSRILAVLEERSYGIDSSRMGAAMKESPAVKDALRRFYDRFSRGDVAAFERGLSREPGSMVIGTAPAEWYEGRDIWVAAYAEQIAAIPGIRVESGDPRGWDDDAVGWVADRPTFVLPDGTAIPARLTMVFRQEEGEWRPVQAHFSLGVPDEKLMDVLGGASS
jgi:hypothetical protein